MRNGIRCAVYGAGAMGTVLGAYLWSAGIEADLITRNAAHVRALNARGAHISGGAEFTQPVRALLPEEMDGQYDVVFLLTKQSENAKTAQYISRFLSENGVICTMQNGLPEKSVAGVVGEERTLGCVLTWGAVYLGAGEVRLASSPSKMNFTLGSPFEKKPAADGVLKILSAAGKAAWEQNFIGARFSKLAINSAFSPVSALTGLTFGKVAKNKNYRPLVLGLMNEAFAVGKACGVRFCPMGKRDIVRIFGHTRGIGGAAARMLLPFAMKGHGDIVSGMYYDLKKGAPCEMGYINGVLSSLGRRTGTLTPLNDGVLALCRDVEEGKSQLGENLVLGFAKSIAK